MRVLHISDLHFGAISSSALESIEGFIQTQQESIDLIIVTGDWTQRAKRSQFRQAREFLLRLKLPILSVPGNHDIPLYNWFRRFMRPLKNYRYYIEPFTLRKYSDHNVAIWGLSTVDRFKMVEGEFSKQEYRKAYHFFKNSPENVIKVIACHHPLINPKTKKWLSGMKRLRRLKPDIILSGHSHLLSAEYQKLEGGHKTLSIVSGTSTSGRLRGEANSFHLIDMEYRKAGVMSYFLSTEGFIKVDDEPQLFTF